MTTVTENEQDVVEAWKIGLFTEKVNEVLTEKGMKNLHRNTLDNWFKRLEKENIHYLSRSGKEKIYFNLDLQIALFISQKKEAGWELDGIFNVISSNFETRQEQSEANTKSTEVEKEESMELIQIKKELMERLDTFNLEYEEKMKELTRESIVAKRINRKNDLLADNKIRKKLRNEAIELWNKEPDDERMIVQKSLLGLVKIKTEDISRREYFINNYIDNHYEQSVLEEFDLQNNDTLSIEHK